MGVLLFDGVDDRLRWTALATALSNTSNGAYTAAAVLKGVGMTTGADFDGIAYLLAGAGNGTTEAGFSFNSSDNPICDIDGSSPPASGTALVDGTTYIVVAKKAAGTVRPTYDWFPFGGAWSHAAPAGGGTNPDQAAATMLDIGVWEASSDPYSGYVGLVGFWEGVMTNVQTEALSTNWKTSDWWNHAFGQPTFLAELNVVAASVTDLAGNASTTSHVGTTLTAGETLDSWNFDGTGAGGGTAHTVTPADSVTMSDAIVMDRGLLAADTVSLADAITMSRGLLFADTVAIADAVVKVFDLAIADSLSISDLADPVITAGTNWTLAFDDTVTLSDAIAQARGLLVSDNVALVDSIARWMNGEFLGEEGAAVREQIRKWFLSKPGWY